MKIYANKEDYSLIDQFAGTNIWVLALYCDNFGTPYYDYVNILSRNGDTITFKRLSNTFVLGNAGDEDIWEYPWSDEEIYEAICNVRDCGSQDCEIYKFSIIENDFEINQPIEIITMNEINDIIDECYDDIIRKFEE